MHKLISEVEGVVEQNKQESKSHFDQVEDIIVNLQTSIENDNDIFNETLAQIKMTLEEDKQAADLVKSSLLSGLRAIDKGITEPGNDEEKTPVLSDTTDVPKSHTKKRASKRKKR